MTLKEFWTDFSLSFLKDRIISLKSRQTGLNNVDNNYYHDVTLFINREGALFSETDAFRSDRRCVYFRLF